MYDPNVRQVVFENLQNAVENGYYVDLDELTALEIVYELQAFACDCEDIDEELLLPHVETWLIERRSMRVR